MRKVLLGADGSENSLRAAQTLGRMVAEMPEVTVTVVHVVHVPRNLQLTDIYGEKIVPDIPMDVMVRRTAEPVLEKAAAALGLPRERVQTEALVGDPAEELVEVARLQKYDLVVVGSRGLGPVEELLLGSVSNKVLHTAPCPVLVVR